MNPRVKKILSIRPFAITALWSDDKVRVTDFARFLPEFMEQNRGIYSKIFQEDIFDKALTDGRTIFWEDLAEIVDYDGQTIPAPLDFCPDVLLSHSEIIEAAQPVTP